MTFSSLAKNGSLPSSYFLIESFHNAIPEGIRRGHSQGEPKVGRRMLPHLTSQDSGDFLLSFLRSIDKEDRALVLVNELPRPSGIGIQGIFHSLCLLNRSLSSHNSIINKLLMHKRGTFRRRFKTFDPPLLLFLINESANTFHQDYKENR